MGFDATGGKPYSGNQGGPVWYALIGLVVVICFAGGFLAPKLLGPPDYSKLTVQEIVQGKSIPEAAGLLNAYGFPDDLTPLVLQRMQQIDEVGHAKLLTNMAERAQAGESRTQLALLMGGWAKTFYIKHASLIRKSDVMHFDQLLLLVEELGQGLRMSGANACDAASLDRIVHNEDLFVKYMYYDGPFHRMSMRAYLLMMEAAVSGKENPQNYGQWTLKDDGALSDMLQDIREDENIDALLSSYAPQSSAQIKPHDDKVQNFEAMDTVEDISSAETPVVASTTLIVDKELVLEGVDACALSMMFVDGVRQLPEETKNRLWKAGVEKLLQPVKSAE